MPIDFFKWSYVTRFMWMRIILPYNKSCLKRPWHTLMFIWSLRNFNLHSQLFFLCAYISNLYFSYWVLTYWNVWKSKHILWIMPNATWFSGVSVLNDTSKHLMRQPTIRSWFQIILLLIDKCRLDKMPSPLSD